jgi:hypothetical protein
MIPPIGGCSVRLGVGASSLREDRAFAASPSSQSALSVPFGLQSQLRKGEVK